MTRNSLLKEICEPKAITDGAYAIAAAVIHLAEAIDALGNRPVSRDIHGNTMLHNPDNAGAIEELAVMAARELHCLHDSITQLSVVLQEISPFDTKQEAAE